ncbi:probable receptor-like protein kinase At5g24010 [Syzygium oleosum]|uniref:probable receptor-like protein kinase At5g24010 n=1 Tax=Syzygium oleosum TaxID=219896 RepID=UPI0024B97372|nr:probable receptor-like protein kinase At5g24010 [Syzygium oleosum]
MAKLLHIHGAHAPGLVLFFVSLHYPLLLLALSSAYTTQTKHFINCGSSNTEKYINRDFVGDTSSDSVSFTKRSTSSTQSSSQSSSVSPIYDTARIFRSPSSQYVLDGTDKGTHMVRLHFFPFASTSNLSAAVFNVSVKGLTLLSNFQIPSSTNSPVVEEFLLSINSTKFVLYFSPQGSSFAFINALEAFLVPDRVIPDSAPSVGTSAINSSNNSGNSSQVSRAVYRINVGGDEVNPVDDSLWRSWNPDDNYIHVPNAAQNKSSYGAGLHYQDDQDQYLASERVYLTAKVMNVNFTNGELYPNTTWSFKVSANAWHLVRAHFCDFISPSLRTVFFNLYVNGNLTEYIDPYGTKGIYQLVVPFHYDFVVQPGNSGLVNISIGLLNASDTTYQRAYLNGLEIMEIIGSWDSDFVPAEGGNQNKHVGLMIGLVSGGIVLLCICVSAAIFICKYRKPKRTEISASSRLPAFGGGSSHSKLTEQSTHGSAVPNFHLGLKVPLAEIHFATNNFDGKLLIGKGGFGNVYRGTLRDGTKVAVKRSELGSGQGFSEFQTEITVLSKIRHRHLVSLIGYCAERSEMILVYEFMEKGSLRDRLYNSDFPYLPWKQRLEICIGAARGLNYLHKGAAGGIIHRDIKPTNILLDENYVAKVADFGLSKSGPLDQSQTHVSTGVKGTFGYLDPEYFKTQQLTEKSDVYSFGVVLLEVLCARPAIDPSLPRDQANLADWGITCIQNGIIEQIVDPHLAGQINPNSLRKYGQVAEKCVQEEDEKRPSMGDVLWDLEYALQLQQTAVKREMYDDSVTDGSSILTLSNVRKLPSFSTDTVEEEGVGKEGADSSEMSMSGVFSQMKIDEAI